MQSHTPCRMRRAAGKQGRTTCLFAPLGLTYGSSRPWRRCVHEPAGRCLGVRAVMGDSVCVSGGQAEHTVLHSVAQRPTVGCPATHCGTVHFAVTAHCLCTSGAPPRHDPPLTQAPPLSSSGKGATLVSVWSQVQTQSNHRRRPAVAKPDPGTRARAHATPPARAPGEGPVRCTGAAAQTASRPDGH